LLAGEGGCALTDGRAASAEVITAVSFAASIYMLLYAIVQFFQVRPAYSPTSAYLSWLSSCRRLPCSWLKIRSTRLAIPIPLAVGILGAAAWYLGRERRRSESPTGRVAQQFRTVVPYITVAVVGAAMVRSVVGLRYASPATHIAPGEAWLWVALLAFALLVQSVALSFQKGVEVPFGGFTNSTGQSG
jgi:hypothetical protein